MNQVVAIRVDGNHEIGFGHIMRTQALARQLERCGAKVVFLSRNPENIKSYTVKPLTYPVKPENERRDIKSMIQALEADIFIADSYEFDQEWLDWMGQLNLLSVFIDDLNRYTYNVDFVLNGNLYAPNLNYQGKAHKLLGAQYLLLREEFQDIKPPEITQLVTHVLITLGGADSENVTPTLLDWLLANQGLTSLNWHVVIGPAFRNIREIELLAEGRTNVFLHHNPNMADLINMCDLAITAAGSTVYEAAIYGLPAILIVTSDNQEQLAEEAHRQGMGLNVGWFERISKFDVYQSIEKLIGNYELRRQMAFCGRQLIDGLGAFRTAQVLLDAVKYRPKP